MTVSIAVPTIRSTSNCWGQSFGYDRYANLHTINVTQCSASTLSLSVSTTTNRITNSGFSYDAAGELLTDGFGGTFTWNAEGRMAATAGYTYTYDGDGRRVKKSDGRNLLSTGRGGTTNSNRKLYWYGLGGAVLAESDLSGSITAEFIYFGGSRIARRDLDYLLLGVGPRIPGVGDEPINRPQLDPPRRRARDCRGSAHRGTQGSRPVRHRPCQRPPAESC